MTKKTKKPKKIESPENDLFEAFKRAVEKYNQSFEDTAYLTDAISECRHVIQTFPSAAEPYFLLGLLAYRLGDEGQAILMCETAHKMEPDTREYAEALSIVMIGIGKLADGLYFAKLVPSLEPHPYLSTVMPSQLQDLQGAFESASPSAHLPEALRLFNLADYSRVIKECSSEVRINPHNFEAYILFARTLLIVGNYHQAKSALHAAIQIDPTAALPRAMLARTLIHIAEFAEASAIAEHAIQMSPTDPEVYAQAMVALLQCPGYDVMRAKSIAEKFQSAFNDEYDPDLPETTGSAPDRPLHIGFISNAFFNNLHSDLFSTWFSSKRAENVKYFGYQQSYLTDSITTVAQGACEQWRQIYDVDPYTLSITIQADELDVLVDLSGTDWVSRAATMGLLPSPVRVGAFFLPEPGFAPGITHVLCDDVLVEADDGVLLPGQETIQVNGSLFARPPYSVLFSDIAMPAERNGYVTFGGVMDLIHLSPECALMWANVLHAVPNSKLLFCGDETTNDKLRQKVREYFSHAGVIDRIMFPSPTNTEAEQILESAEAGIPNHHWEEIDIFLDTAPSNCRTELCEALWTGAPVISLRSSRRNGLIGASILTAAKRLNWIARTPHEFIEIATRLGTDLDKLKKERDRLQKNISKSALFDHQGLAAQIRNSLSELGRNSRIKIGSSS